MVADILPEEKRADGFGVMRVVANLAWIVGPTIGGFMAARSYMLLFIMDAVTSLITAVIIFRMIPETKPKAAEEEPESFLGTLAGYSKIFADRLFISYILVSMLMLVVYIQMYNTLSVYLRDVHGVSPQGYGFILTMSAVTVILFQFWVTRRVKKYPPMLMMALGSGFYLVGFSMYGFVSAYALFIAAMVLITVGEMIVMPVGQALAANFAPADMRGRYMALFSLAWALPATIGPALAGMILDNYNPNWVWYAAGIISSLAIAGFLWLHLSSRERLAAVPEEAPATA
jgi:predicted MFS family arabinose efflux permease